MGLSKVEAGAQGNHKLQRGYLPCLTYSSHYIRDPYFRSAVAKFVTEEGETMETTVDILRGNSNPYKDGIETPGM